MDFASFFDLISTAQSSKELTANNMLNALSPAGMFATRSNTSGGLIWGYYGGHYFYQGALQSVANGTVALTANSTNYVEIDLVSGTVSTNTTGFTPGRLPLYKVTTNNATPAAITGWTDYRMSLQGERGRQGADVASANNLVLTIGNRFRVSGAVQINLIDATGRGGGDRVTLNFLSTPTVKHNQVASGVNKPIFLAAAVDFVAAAQKQLRLEYDVADAIWYQV